MSLSADDLQDPQIRSGLLAVTETIQSLLQRHTQPVRQTPEEIPDSGEEEEVRAPQFWRAKNKSQAEKNEKKARLEKREAILRDLRSRVTQFKNENQDFDDDNVRSSSVAESFDARLQRAAFWPAGSLEWARQLLGIELGMTAAEKRQRYLDMVKVCHPDQNRAIDPQAIQQINAAWDIVCQ
ncbi:MAG: DnaJ domain [Pseudomonadota bacterium]